MRLDRFCALEHPEHSRARLSRLIREGEVTVNGAACRPSRRLETGETVELIIPPLVEPRLEPEPIPLDVLYEDEWMLVLDKQAGIVVHPGAGIDGGTLAAALLHRDPCLAGVGGPGRCGLVHRLDRGTTGVMVVARSAASHHALSEQFRARTVDKLYHAVVWGRPTRPEGEIDRPIGRDPRRRVRMTTRGSGGRRALSRYRVLAEVPGFALVGVTILTGRTHQVRVHLAEIGHPIVGDLTYAGDRTRGLGNARHRTLIRGLGRPALHARRLRLSHPADGRPLTFVAPWPRDLEELWTGLGGVVPGRDSEAS
jgi:23S rRNA pseudouridine1911/1915/1917 synthase